MSWQTTRLSDLKNRSLSVFPAGREVAIPCCERKVLEDAADSAPSWFRDGDVLAFRRACSARRMRVRAVVTRFRKYIARIGGAK